MRRPFGVLLVVTWCLMRGAAGTWGAVRLAIYARQGIDTWSNVLGVFVIEGAIWLWLAYALVSKWNLARLVAVLWCAITIVWSTYGFVSVALPRWSELRYGGVYLAAVLIHGGIILYLLRSAVARYYKGERMQQSEEVPIPRGS